MRHFCLLLTLSFVFISSYANDADGYIVTLNNDTVNVQIKLSGGFFLGIGKYDTKTQVQILDSSGNIKVLTPSDIKGYGYTYKSDRYIYRVKPIEDGSLCFLRAIIIGVKTSLYAYSKVRAGGSFYPGAGYSSASIHEFYTFEKSDSSYLFITNYAGLGAFKEKLKNFYKDNTEVQQLIHKKFMHREKIERDIKDILDVVNNS